MKIKLALLALALTCLAAEREETQRNNLLATQIEWKVGKLVLAGRTPSRRYPDHEIVIDSNGQRILETGPGWNFAPDETIEIGLRADGVIVWRNAK